MNKKPGFFQRAEQFLAGKGFYMVLLLCLVILGVSGFFLFQTVSDLISDEPVSVEGEVNVPDPRVEVEVTPPTEQPTPDDGLEVDPSAATSDPVESITVPVIETPEVPEVSEPVSEAPESVEVMEPKEDVTSVVFGWPVNGDVVTAFSATELTYNEMLGDWRAHTGIDIAADVGTDVFSAADGTVESIRNDPLTGTTITLSHENGLSTVYGNLDADTLSVAEGDRISGGTILACVGSAGEQTVPCLHFAMLEDGKCIDPNKYLG